MRDRSHKNFVSGGVYGCRILPSLDAKTEIPTATCSTSRPVLSYNTTFSTAATSKWLHQPTCVRGGPSRSEGN